MGRFLLYLAGLVFLLWTVATSLTQVQPNERAVVRRFGRILERKPEQGLYIGLPWGIDRVDLVDVKVRNIDVGYIGKEDIEEEVIPAGQMLTGDHNLVNVKASIDYRVQDNDKALEGYILQKDQIDGFVSRAAESLLAEWVASRDIRAVLLEGKIELPDMLRAQLPARLAEYGLGIEIVRATVSKLDPPDQVKSDFERVAQVQNVIKARLDEAGTQANRMRDVESSEKYRLDRSARSYQQEELSKATTEANTFNKRLAQYREFSRKNPDYLNALWLDEITRLYTRMRENGRIELLDSFLTSEGLTITQFPLQPRKK